MIKVFEPALFPFHLSISFSCIFILQQYMQILQGKSAIFFSNILPFNQITLFHLPENQPLVPGYGNRPSAFCLSG